MPGPVQTTRCASPFQKAATRRSFNRRTPGRCRIVQQTFPPKTCQTGNWPVNTSRRKRWLIRTSKQVGCREPWTSMMPFGRLHAPCAPEPTHRVKPAFRKSSESCNAHWHIPLTFGWCSPSALPVSWQDTCRPAFDFSGLTGLRHIHHTPPELEYFAHFGPFLCRKRRSPAICVI